MLKFFYHNDSDIHTDNHNHNDILFW